MYLSKNSIQISQAPVSSTCFHQHPAYLCSWSWVCRGCSLGQTSGASAAGWLSWNHKNIHVILMIKRSTVRTSNIRHYKSQYLNIYRSSCSCLCPILWSQVFSREWRSCWSSADRRCSKVHLCDQQFYCLWRYNLYQRFDDTYQYPWVTAQSHQQAKHSADDRV